MSHSHPHSHGKSFSSYLYLGAATIIIVLLIFVATRSSGPSKYESFAQCLTEQDVVMYGAWWCPHCTNQKQLFEGAFNKITYVECSAPGSRAMNQTCQDAGVQSYPTWEFADKSRLTGERTLTELSQKTNCELPQEEGV